MTQEQKNLLLKDLCGRLPYKVIAQIPDEHGGYTSAIESIDIDGFVVDFDGEQMKVEDIKPYLFPLSSMTWEQECQYREVIASSLNHYEVYDWLNKNHFDYRGLIPMCIAKDATGKNIY